MLQQGLCAAWGKGGRRHARAQRQTGTGRGAKGTEIAPLATQRRRKGEEGRQNARPNGTCGLVRAQRPARATPFASQGAHCKSAEPQITMNHKAKALRESCTNAPGRAPHLQERRDALRTTVRTTYASGCSTAASCWAAWASCTQLRFRRERSRWTATPEATPTMATAATKASRRALP